MTSKLPIRRSLPAGANNKKFQEIVQRRREQGLKTDSIVEQILLNSSEPLFFREIHNSVSKIAGHDYHEVSIRESLKRLAQARKVSARNETDDERECRSTSTGAHLRGRQAILYFAPAGAVPARRKKMKTAPVAAKKKSRPGSKTDSRRVVSPNHPAALRLRALEARVDELEDTIQKLRDALR